MTDDTEQPKGEKIDFSAYERKPSPDTGWRADTKLGRALIHMIDPAKRSHTLKSLPRDSDAYSDLIRNIRLRAIDSVVPSRREQSEIRLEQLYDQLNVADLIYKAISTPPDQLSTLKSYLSAALYYEIGELLTQRTDDLNQQHVNRIFDTAIDRLTNKTTDQIKGTTHDDNKKNELREKLNAVIEDLRGPMKESMNALLTACFHPEFRKDALIGRQEIRAHILPIVNKQFAELLRAVDHGKSKEDETLNDDELMQRYGKEPFLQFAHNIIGDFPHAIDAKPQSQSAIEKLTFWRNKYTKLEICKRLYTRLEEEPYLTNTRFDTIFDGIRQDVMGTIRRYVGRRGGDASLPSDGELLTDLQDKIHETIDELSIQEHESKDTFNR